MKILPIVGAACIAISMLSVGSPANAAGRDGHRDVGEMLFFYNSNLAGSFVDFETSKSDLAGYKFVSSGAGQGQYVKNNAASAWNYDVRADETIIRASYVYYNSGYSGPSDYFKPGDGHNLENTYNDNASWRWVCYQPC